MSQFAEFRNISSFKSVKLAIDQIRAEELRLFNIKENPYKRSLIAINLISLHFGRQELEHILKGIETSKLPSSIKIDEDLILFIGVKEDIDKIKMLISLIKEVEQVYRESNLRNSKLGIFYESPTYEEEQRRMCEIFSYVSDYSFFLKTKNRFNI